MFDRDDWGRWGIEDMHPDMLEDLKKAVESGECFDSGWHGFAKTEYGFRVSRDENGITIECHEEMDEGHDLIYDCVTDSECEMLTDEILDEIEEILSGCCEFSYESYQTGKLMAETSFEKVIEEIRQLIIACHEELNSSYYSVVVYGSSPRAVLHCWGCCGLVHRSYRKTVCERLRPQPPCKVVNQSDTA